MVCVPLQALRIVCSLVPESLSNTCFRIVITRLAWKKLTQVPRGRKIGCKYGEKKKWERIDLFLIVYSFFFFAFFPFFLPIVVYHSSSSSSSSHSSQSSSSSHSSSSLTFFHLESIAPRDSNKPCSEWKTTYRNAFFTGKEYIGHFTEKKDKFLPWCGVSSLFFFYLPKKDWNRMMNRGTCEVLANLGRVFSERCAVADFGRFSRCGWRFWGTSL